jgi:nucleoside-diphosphate-sugar epimerase
MKFAMTGHRGLIGSFLLKRLEEKGDEPVLLVDKRDGKDISEINKIVLKEKTDVMIHLASFCKINKTIENPKVALENNVLGTFEVMEFCRKNKIPKIVFTSSSRILSKEKNPYTASKIFGEELIKGYSQCYGIDYVIVRPSTVYGPFNDETKRLMDIFILNALKNDELKVFGDESKTLDFTYVEDFIDGFLIAMNQKNKVSDVADFIIELAGKGRKKFYPEEIAQPQKVKIDISPLQKLGYKPKFSIRDGINSTFDWYKENFDKILEERNQFLKPLAAS